MEDHTQILGEATLELLELQRQAEDKMTHLEGCARRENVQIHGVKEVAEGNAQSMTTFVENLLREKLELLLLLELKIERAHCAVGVLPPKDAQPRCDQIIKLLE